MKHKHHDCINAYWAGARIEFLAADDYWYYTTTPQWDDCTEYRIEESMKHDLYRAEVARLESNKTNVSGLEVAINLALIFGLILLAGVFS